MEVLHIPGESWRAYIHVCTCRRWRPGGFRETRKVRKAHEVRTVPEFSKFSGKSVGALMLFLERIFYRYHHPPIRKEYISNMSALRVIEGKGYIFLANPGGCTSMSAHVADGARWILGKRGKCGKFRNFAKFSEKSLGSFCHFLGCIFNDPLPPPLWGGGDIPAFQPGALSGGKGYVFLANPGGRTSMSARGRPTGSSGNGENSRTRAPYGPL